MPCHPSEWWSNEKGWLLNSPPGLFEQDLNQPSTLLPESRYGVIKSSGRSTVRCAEISDEDRALLDAETAPFGLEMELTIFDSTDTPFCYGQQTWCSELAEFTLLAKPG